MFFSVVIPTFNRKAFLEDAVQSVLEQTCGDFELIVVDDGSTDGTPSILNARSDARFRFIIHPKNRGVSAARNTGIRISAGTYVCFLDSDDLWKPEKLAMQKEFFEQNPGTLICHTNEDWIANGRRKNQSDRHRKQGGFFFERSLELCLVSPSSVAIHRSLFDEEGFFDEQLAVCEDYDFWLRLNIHHAFGYLETALVVKRGGHADQLSRSTPVMDSYRIKSLLKLIERNDLPDDLKGATIRVLRKKARVVRDGCRKRGKTADAHYYDELIRSLPGP